jgi:hypothetical protein
MKDILSKCKRKFPWIKKSKNNNVKLRLRGQGSGHYEGPQN